MDARTKPGLRERKKQETRSALAWAAIRLAVRRGLDNVLVEDIAAEVGVSPRTFNNYFASKADAIASRHVDRMRRVVAALPERPATESLWQALEEAVVSQFLQQSEDAEAMPDPQWRGGVHRMTAEPSVQAALLRGSREVEHELAAAIADRLGVPADQMYPQLVASALGVAVRVALDNWWRADPPVTVPAALRAAIKRVSNLSS
ncbi:TetR/AcrR family transcriptional regulator [Fodinicola acaciae]|uniref:TetR/AcrR family transcriptional regulator n=1 Tax=Fodinicola acaciae TaxID=2681555 RepID=UPI0013D59067|nr:TetR family transcriptional regulator [Fodinicola acaciae]